jgi:hypothetical protein
MRGSRGPIQIQTAILLGALIVLATTSVAAQEPSASDPPSANEQQSWGERLEPNRLSIGAFPNSSGNIDFSLWARLRYLDRFSSSMDADYRTYTKTFEPDADSPIEGTSNLQESEVAIDFLKTIFVLSRAAGLALSVEPGIHGKYITTDNETYGYRTNTDDTISFFHYTVNTRQVIAGLVTDVTTDLSSTLNVDIRGAAYPLIVIFERGTKRYSQIENPLKFSTENFAMGFETTADIEVDINRMVKASIGKLSFTGGFLRRFGQYSSQNVIALYNWKTTINTVAPLTRSVITAGGDFELSFLGKWIDIIPAVGVLYERTIENYDGTVSDTAVWKAGLTARL